MDPPRTAESIGREVKALRTANTLQANLIGRLADALYMTSGERDLLAVLQAERDEVAAWAATWSPPLI